MIASPNNGVTEPVPSPEIALCHGETLEPLHIMLRDEKGYNIAQKPKGNSVIVAYWDERQSRSSAAVPVVIRSTKISKGFDCSNPLILGPGIPFIDKRDRCLVVELRAPSKDASGLNGEPICRSMVNVKYRPSNRVIAIKVLLGKAQVPAASIDNRAGTPAPLTFSPQDNWSSGKLKCCFLACGGYVSLSLCVCSWS